jgi:hypothetical protein
MKKSLLGLIALALCGATYAKLPEPTPEAKAAAAAAKEKAAWGDKVAAYKLCLSQNKVVAHYVKTRNVTPNQAESVPACKDPGPYVPSAQQAGQVGVADAKPVPAAGKPAQPNEAKK